MGVLEATAGDSNDGHGDDSDDLDHDGNDKHDSVDVYRAVYRRETRTRQVRDSYDRAGPQCSGIFAHL